MSASLFTMENRLARSWPSPSCPAKLLSPNGRTMTMKRNNILVIFDDETRVVYAPQSSVRIANRGPSRSEEHTSELQSLMRISYAVFCLKKTPKHTTNTMTPLTAPHNQ